MVIQLSCEHCGSEKIKTKTKRNITGKILCNSCYDKIHKSYNENKLTKRTKYDKNEFINYNNYAEMYLYDSLGNKKASTFIDSEDVDKISKHKWYLDSTNYVRTTINGKKIRLHNFLMNPNPPLVVDHIDGNKLNNCKSNYQICTHAQNTQKAQRKKINISGILGVVRDGKGWSSYIEFDEERYRKYFKIKEDAIIQRLKWELHFFKEFSPQIELIKSKYSDLLMRKEQI